MKLINFTLVAACVFLFVSHLNAQDGPPPPPLIWKAPVVSEIKKYTNSKHGFSVDFPGTPEVTERPNDIMDYYTVRRSGSTMWVRVISFTKQAPEKLSNEEIIQQEKVEHGS